MITTLRSQAKKYLINSLDRDNMSIKVNEMRNSKNSLRLVISRVVSRYREERAGPRIPGPWTARLMTVLRGCYE